MRSLFLAISFALLIVVFDSCEKNKDKPFDYERAAGMWVPYEVLQEGGMIDTFTVTTTSVFGSYAASVQLNKDQSFIPVIWLDRNNFTLQTPETDHYEYLPGNKLSFGGFFHFECDIVKFEGDYLWLKMHGNTWKFKKQH